MSKSFDLKRNISLIHLTEEEREAFVNSFPDGNMRKAYERQKAEGGFNPPPKWVNPMDEMKEQVRKLSEEIEKLKKKNASLT